MVQRLVVAGVQVELPQVVVMAVLDVKLVVIEIVAVLEGWMRLSRANTATSRILVYTYMQNSRTRFKTNAPFEDSSIFSHTCSLVVLQLFLVPPSTCPETAPHPNTSSLLHM